jgi:ABC-type branched-subunit amino acid transport system ATPase component
VSELLQVAGLTAGYGGAPVLRNLDLTVGPGEVVALLGPNGAGKTTTLRVISGLLRATAGEVVFDGAPVGSASAHAISKRGLAHVPEGRGIFYSLTVAEHFRLGYGGVKGDPEEAYERFPALGPLRNRRAGLLSGGEQQMLALARVLICKRKLLLIDELSLGLAPVIVDAILPTLRQFAEETGGGVLIVEQHVQRVLDVADRGYVLSHGELVMEGAAEKLRADRHLIMASYLGRNA